ncbi:TPA: hypothetical protein VGT17_005217 [Vibrio harveyi]|nr:hypothetical protein [Vibrio harveyi]HEQ3599249.1 hypothetical protein [Vibrio harveyi]HEQ3611307.1 hypothetical protein [Vibrio harveyi]
MSAFIKRVPVGEREYLIKICSANQQWQILNLFFKYGLSDALYRLAMSERDLVAASLLGRFAESATDQEKVELSEMLLNGCMRADVENAKPVTVDDFHNDMFAYLCLHVEALKVNFADFMPFLQSPEGETEETPAQQMSPL